jgi:hypothetical protein
LQYLVAKTKKTRGDIDDFMKAAELVAARPDYLQPLQEQAHPTYKALLAIHTRLKKDVPSDSYCNQLLRDLAEWKLCGKVSQAKPPCELSNEDLLKAAHIVTPAWGCMSDNQVPPTTEQVFNVLQAAAATEERTAQERKPPRKDHKGRQKATTNHHPDQLLRLGLQGQAPRQCNHLRRREINLQQMATFPIRSQVRTRAHKHKKEYHDQRGEIQALMNKKARVMLLTGIKTGYSLSRGIARHHEQNILHITQSEKMFPVSTHV